MDIGCEAGGVAGLIAPISTSFDSESIISAK